MIIIDDELRKTMRLEHVILRMLAQSGAPMGSGTLRLLLRRTGTRISSPTIGRKLRDLEFHGFLRKSSVKGRVITDKGRTLLERMEREAQLDGKSKGFLRVVVHSADEKRLLDLLAARRIIEGEIAFWAARHASAATVRKLEQIIQRQAESLARGGLGIEQDVAFHEEIARASGNEVLHSIVSILKSNEHYNYLVTFMRRTVGGRLVLDHTEIVGAIKRRDSEAARAAMEKHLTALREDVKRYWKRWLRFRARNPSGRTGSRDGLRASRSAWS